MHDYSTNYHFSSADLEHWPGRVLVIESAHDEAFSTAARSALRALYPRARVRTFGRGGHAVMITNPAEYVDAVRAFLDAA
jgi:pimeloyl-ACP methyl ester carboxylesterase